MKILGTLATLAVAQAQTKAAVDPLAVMTCQSVYSNHEGDNDCDALVTLAKCFAIAGVDDLPMTDGIRRTADDFLVGQQAKAECYKYEQQGKPAITIVNGDMDIDVDGPKDIRIVRFRKETVSLFDLSNTIRDLENYQKTELPQKLSDVTAFANGAAAEATENAKTLASNVADELAKVTSAIEDEGKRVNRAIDALKSSTAKQRGLVKTQVQAALNSGVSQVGNDVKAATTKLSAQASADKSKFSALESEIAKINAGNSAGKAALAGLNEFIVGWHQCQVTGSNGADNTNFVGQTCAYTKKRDDTIMMISVNSNQRQINGNSKWRFQVSSANSGGWRACSGPNNEGAGNIYTRYHGSRSVDLHRPMYVGGACFKTDNNQPIKKGRMQARWIQTYVSSDSYWNWESSARMILEERLPPN